MFDENLLPLFGINRKNKTKRFVYLVICSDIVAMTPSHTTPSHMTLSRTLNVLAALKDKSAVDTLYQESLGKNGWLTKKIQTLKTLDPLQQKKTGQDLHQEKKQLILAFQEKKRVLEKNTWEKRLEKEYLDLTLPSLSLHEGRLHPLSVAMEQLRNILKKMGFQEEDGPDIEDDFHNFTALNMPPHHPARAMQDTFYFCGKDKAAQKLLRTHTSPVQIRALTKKPGATRLMSVGRVYRCDYDQTHTPMFHQIEGLVVDKTIHMGHLKGCLEKICRDFFENPSLAIRLRPSYFPFTEPSAEVDIQNHDQQWVEVLGCGMVHPHVLANCGMDPSVYQGIAFGMGVERMAMLKYAMADLRPFFENDQRWLSHYGFSATHETDAP